MSNPRASCHRLDKNLFAAGVQCAKRLYQDFHTPEAVPTPSPSRKTFAQLGIKLTAMACEGFPSGERVDEESHALAVEKTLELLEVNDGRAIFNAAFSHNGVQIYCDVVLPGREGKEITIFEVKSGTKVKPRHVMDIALQMWVIESHGYTVSSASLLHMDAEYHHDGSDDYPVHKLFKNVDVTNKARKRKHRIPDLLENFHSALDDKATLELPTGTWCINPIPCGYLSECKKNTLPNSLLELPDLTVTQEYKLHQGGAATIDQIDPETSELTRPQSRALRAVKQDTLVLEPVVAEEFGTLVFPVCFTTINFALQVLPQFKKSRPWQHMPYQWSAHVLHEDGTLEHRKYLAKVAKDPRPEILASLLDCIDDVGTVVTWSKKLEPFVRKVMEDFPDLKEDAKSLLLMDPLAMDMVVREGVYHSDFRGSFALNSVHSALTGKPAPKRTAKAVNDDDDAWASYEKLVNSRTRATTRTTLSEALSEYAKSQSMQLLEIYQKLQGHLT